MKYYILLLWWKRVSDSNGNRRFEDCSWRGRWCERVNIQKPGQTSVSGIYHIKSGPLKFVFNYRKYISGKDRGLGRQTIRGYKSAWRSVPLWVLLVLQYLGSALNAPCKRLTRNRWVIVLDHFYQLLKWKWKTSVLLYLVQTKLCRKHRKETTQVMPYSAFSCLKTHRHIALKSKYNSH